jgi:hypothetical protein
MIRCASLVALSAFGLSNVAHASFALTQAGPTDLAPGLITVAAGVLQFTPDHLASGSISEAVASGEQAFNTITSNADGSGSLEVSAPGGTVSLSDLTLKAINSALYAQTIRAGDVQLTPGAITVISAPITLETPTVNPGVTTPAPAPVEPVALPLPLPLEGVIPPALPMPEPAYLQQAGMACSGAFSVTFGAQTTVNCQADLWFTKGFVSAGQFLQANARGNILVDGVSFAAPNMQFNAGANFVTSNNPIWFDGHATINAVGVNIAGLIQVSNAGSLTINSQTINHNPAAIPEPSTWALMGLGLVGLSLAARRKA